MAPESNRYDLVVIGSGPGGYVAAIRAAQLGMKVACVEKRESLGGTCLNIGCIPSKALLDSSELYHLAHTKFAKHGIKVDAIGLDLPAMLARKDTVVKSLTDGLKFLFKKNKIEPVFGTARVASGESVVVRDAKGVETTLETKHILLATGSAPVNLPFIPFNGKTIVSSTEALTFDRVPEHLVVVGGGYIGLELGSVWKRLGAKVTVIEFLPRIVPMADLEVGTLLHKSLIKQGLEFHLETKVTGAKVKGTASQSPPRPRTARSSRSLAIGSSSPSAVARTPRALDSSKRGSPSTPRPVRSRSTPTTVRTFRPSRPSATWWTDPCSLTRPRTKGLPSPRSWPARPGTSTTTRSRA